MARRYVLTCFDPLPQTRAQVREYDEENASRKDAEEGGGQSELKVLGLFEVHLATANCFPVR